MYAEFVNGGAKWKRRPRVTIEAFVSMFRVVAPHVAEEMWEPGDHIECLGHVAWPKYN